VGPLAWKASHKSEVSTRQPAQIASTSLPSSATRTPATVRLELRDGKPGADVLVDNQPKGKVSRRGTFVIDLLEGDHRIEWTTRNRVSGTILRHFSAGSPVELGPSDLVSERPTAPNLPPTAPPNAEQTEWQKVKDSNAASDLEQFLKRYPKSEFGAEAQAKLDDLDWNAAASNMSYEQYVEKFPQGRHAQQARDAMTDSEWRSLQESSDSGAIKTFLDNHPSGAYHEKALSKLDDLGWLRTRQNDATTFRSYLESFPEGHHAAEARKRMADLSSASTVPPAAKSSVEPSASDEKNEILDVLGRYRKAYEGHDLRLLKEIWPNMSAQQVKSLGDFFANASGLSLYYHLLEGPTVEGSHATVAFQQSLTYVVNGKAGKDSAKVTMRLAKSQGTAEIWRIASIK